MLLASIFFVSYMPLASLLYGLGFTLRVHVLRFMVYDLELRVHVLRFMVYDLELWVWALGLRTEVGFTIFFVSCTALRFSATSQPRHPKPCTIPSSEP